MRIYTYEGHLFFTVGSSITRNISKPFNSVPSKDLKTLRTVLVFDAVQNSSDQNNLPSQSSDLKTTENAFRLLET